MPQNNIPPVPADFFASENKARWLEYLRNSVKSLFKHKYYEIKTTSTTESINVNTCQIIRQTASGITTSLSGVETGSGIIIKNRSGGTNTLNITVEGSASPTLEDGESVTLVYNGTDWDIL